VPTREEVYRYLTAPLMGEDAVDKLGDPRRVMLDLCDDLNLTCLDLLPLLQDYALEGDDLYYAEDMHLNPRGNQVVADIIQNWLIELNLIDEQ
jgi:lysophospholipase L1-like esterase